MICFYKRIDRVDVNLIDGLLDSVLELIEGGNLFLYENLILVIGSLHQTPQRFYNKQYCENVNQKNSNLPIELNSHEYGTQNNN